MLRNIEYCAPAQQSKRRYQWQAGWAALRMVLWGERQATYMDPKATSVVRQQNRPQ
jgi:hypothetical protein